MTDENETFETQHTQSPRGAWASRSTWLVTAVCLLCGCATHTARGAEAGTGSVSAALAPSTVLASFGNTGGLIQSTGNIYWTASGMNAGEARPYWASVFRAAKSNPPGSESTLYTEVSDVLVTFGDITYAFVDSVWYGYFVANDPRSSTSIIKRVPLAGGPAISLTDSPEWIGGLQTLHTDGTGLYWADALGVRGMAIQGGSVVTFATVSQVTALALDRIRIFYAAGNKIYSVLKNGSSSSPSTVATGLSGINSLAIRPGGGSVPPTLYWGEEGSGVFSKPLGGSSQGWKLASGNRRITSLSFDGTHVLYLECEKPFNTNCVAYSSPGPYGFSGIVAAGTGARSIQGDASGVFYANNSAIFRSMY